MSMKTLGLCVVVALPLLFGCTEKKVASPKQSQGTSDDGEVEGDVDAELERGREYRFSGVTLKLKGKPRVKEPDSKDSKYPPKKVEVPKNKASDTKSGSKLPSEGQLVQ